MLSNVITGFIVIASVLQVPLPIAIGESVYPVPTVTSDNVKQTEQVTQKSEDFEWRVLQQMHASEQAAAPIKKSQQVDPTVQARAAMFIDGKSQHVLWQKNPDAAVPIASITKLMTALVWFDHQPTEKLNHIHTFAPEEDQPDGKELNLPHGAQLSALNLLNGAIVGSNNDMIVGLAHTTSLTDEAYISAMNEKAKAIGMRNTTFADMTGLSAKNTATVYDVARLAQVAFWNANIATPAGQATHRQETLDGSFKNTIYTTNTLLYDRSLDVTAGKTGYIPQAGYCVVVKIAVPESAGGDADDSVIVVILGAGSDDARFTQAKKIAEWAFADYDWSNK